MCQLLRKQKRQQALTSNREAVQMHHGDTGIVKELA